MIFQLTNGFYHPKQVWKPIKYYVLINGDLQITESCQEAWAVALKYEMNHEKKKNDNISSHPMPH
jgi:hypothetical protein